MRLFILFGIIVLLAVGVIIALRSAPPAPPATPATAPPAAGLPSSGASASATVPPAGAHVPVPGATTATATATGAFAPAELATLRPALADFCNPANPDRLPPDLHTRLPRVTAASEISAVAKLLTCYDEPDAVRNEAINLLRNSGWEDLNATLITLLNRPDERARIRSFFAQHLGMSLTLSPISEQREAIIERLETALSDRDLEVRRESLAALVGIGNAKAMTVVENGLSDPAWAKARDVIVYALRDANRQDAVGALRPLAYDADSVVRIAAIAVLGEWRDEASRAAFIEARDSSVKRLQRAGTLALATLDGRKGPPLVAPVVVSIPSASAAKAATGAALSPTATAAHSPGPMETRSLQASATAAPPGTRPAPASH